MESHVSLKKLKILKKILSKNFISLIFIITVGILIGLIKPPNGVHENSYKLFGIFISMIFGVIIQPYPMGMIALTGFTLMILFRLVEVKEAFSCFSSNVIWLIVVASAVSKSITKTKLGERIANYFLKFSGKNAITLGVGITVADFFFAPFIPSNTARTVCFLLPLIISTSEILGSSPKNGTEKKIGNYLAFCAIYANQIASSIFLTGMSNNLLIQDIMAKNGFFFGWCDWFFAASVPGIISLFLSPFLIYKMQKPELSSNFNAKEIGEKNLKKMEKMSLNEWIIIFTLFLMLSLWIFGPKLKIDSVTTALIGLIILLLTKVINFSDFLSSTDGWNVLIWMSIFVIFANKLTDFGLINHYSEILNNILFGYTGGIVLIILSIIFFYAHYLFPGNVLHACALFPAFFKMAITFGAPPILSGLIFGFITAFCGFITPYGSSTCGIIYGSRYVKSKDWWILGFIFGVIHLLIWGIIGGFWWKILGLY